MPHSLKQNIRLHLRVAGAGTLGLLVGFLVVGSMIDLATSPVSLHDRSSDPIPEEAAVAEGPIMSAAAPVRLRIPRLDIDAKFEGPLGLNERSEVEVPTDFDKVGWYQYGPTPGELGPAVVLGHVDSYLGPAVFFSIKNLEIYDKIYVDREDGTTAVFSVMGLEKLAQSDFPTDKVYSDLNYAGLRLITCTGVYNRSVQRYSHNLIVYAKLVSTEE